MFDPSCPDPTLSADQFQISSIDGKSASVRVSFNFDLNSLYNVLVCALNQSTKQLQKLVPHSVLPNCCTLAFVICSNFLLCGLTSSINKIF